MQARSAISNQQKNQQIQAALQDAVSTKKEEVKQLQEEKTAVLAQVSELQQQLKDGQVCITLDYMLWSGVCRMLCLICMLHVSVLWRC